MALTWLRGERRSLEERRRSQDEGRRSAELGRRDEDELSALGRRSLYESRRSMRPAAFVMMMEGLRSLAEGRRSPRRLLRQRRGGTLGQ